MGRCTVSLLGGFELRVDGRPVSADGWRSRCVADLVKLLALESTHQLHRERVMDQLWPELGMEAAGANLRKAVHFARRAMGAQEAIVSMGGMLSLWGGDVEVDAQRFLAAADTALAAADEEGCALAADMFIGEPMPADRYEAWAAEPRAHLTERHLAVLKGARRWQRVLQLDPTDEVSHRELMRRYYEDGRRHEAIRQFERLRDTLREFIGVGPDPDTIALYERILDIECEEPPSPAERAAALIATGLVHLNRGELSEAERLAREAKAMAIDAGLGHELGDAATLLAVVSFWTGRWNDVFREEFTASLAHEPALAMATYDANVCFAEYYVSGTDGPAGAAAYARELVNLAAEAGSVPGRGLAQLMLGEAFLFSGDFEGPATSCSEHWSSQLRRDSAASVPWRWSAWHRSSSPWATRGRRAHCCRRPSPSPQALHSVRTCWCGYWGSASRSRRSRWGPLPPSRRRSGCSPTPRGSATPARSTSAFRRRRRRRAPAISSGLADTSATLSGSRGCGKAAHGRRRSGRHARGSAWPRGSLHWQ